MLREDDARRRRLIVDALWLTWISIVWGTVSGGVSVTVGLLDGSLGVLGLGLNVLADVTGSAVLVWRFRAELRHSGRGANLEARAAVIVAAALGTVSLILVVSAVHALAVGSQPGHSTLGIVVAGLAIVVLTPLAYAKRRVAAQLNSRALRGDGALPGSALRWPYSPSPAFGWTMRSAGGGPTGWLRSSWQALLPSRRLGPYGNDGQISAWTSSPS